MRKPLMGLLFVLVLLSVSLSPLSAGRQTEKAALQELAAQIEKEMEQRRPQLYYDLLNSTDPAQQVLNNDPNFKLMYIKDNGMPVYYRMRNINAARTVSTDDVWPGGGAGHSLTGSATTTLQLGIWDGGGVLLTHQEFGGRVTQMDSPSGTHWHSTHAAGTMVAAGVQANAKGMSYQAQLAAYDWNSDTSEMAAAAAAGMRVSNHSYGYAAGWEYSSPNWYWYGDVSISTVEDYGFGFYDSEVALHDQIAYNAPNYLICKSAGNDRNDFGPGPGGGHYYWNGSWTYSTATRDPDGGTDMYDCIGWIGNAKNILSIGAINDIPAGYSVPGDVVQTSFSSWGYSDDGRIKPDIVANGAGLYSPEDASNTSYLTLSGTSMSSPNAAGSINLLQDHYTAVKGGQAHSATMKAIVIHTADEAGANAGPDYQSGWGLLNTRSAADLIAGDAFGTPHIREATLVDAATDYYYATLASPGDLRVSVVWTDLPGTPPPYSLNPTTPMLVNDIDVRVEYVPLATIFYPWRLNRINPGNAATQADNNIDNIEVVDVTSGQAGLYRIAVTHKGTLSSGAQDYSIVCSERLELTAVPIPTLSEWGMIGLAAIILLFGATMIVRRSRRTA
ncbi:MAG: IPTL-CTERM sorting domain-containing protein [Candidatus Latescibacterota bacterium]